ncbi:MAG: hypothetical protein ABIH46_01290 [Chloroflexota bacterium]
MKEIEVWKGDEAIMAPTFEGMLKQAEVLIKSGFLPQSIRSAPAALAIMQAGREMGMPPMLSFRSLYFINGNITMSAQMIAAKLLAAGVTYQIDELTNEMCRITFKRNNGMTQTHRFSMEDAKQAQLTSKDNWQKFRRDMLFNRCLASGGRKIAPDVLAGFYTPDELGAIENPETGEVIEGVVIETKLSNAEPTTAPAQSQQEPKIVEAAASVPEPEPSQDTRATNGGALKRAKDAFTKYFYSRWSKLYPEDKDDSLAHEEFRCESMSDLEIGDNQAAKRISPILTIIEWGHAQQLQDNDLKDALCIEQWGDWKDSDEAGKRIIEKWVSGRIRQETQTAQPDGRLL